MTKEEFLERARETHGYKYKYPTLSDKILSQDTIDIEYNGVIYKQKVVKHVLLGRCPEKNTPTKTTEQFIKEAIDVWSNKYDYSLVEYKGALKKVKILFEGIIFEQTAISHLRMLAPELNMNLEYFIKKSTEKWGFKYDYSLVKYVKSDKKVKIIFNGIIYEQTPSGHLYGAPEKIFLKKTNEQFINESNIVHDNKFSYDKVEYVKNQIKVIITCPIHGDFRQTPLSHLQGNGCLNCSESKGEKKIARYLDKNGISYYRQHKFDDCKNIFQLPFDFYVPSIRTAIEFDGIQHFQPVEHFGGLKAYDRLKVNDKVKDDYCEDNYIELVRISYDQVDNIEEILKNYIIK
jgi:very-short-patch-repair endonuclease